MHKFIPIVLSIFVLNLLFTTPAYAEGDWANPSKQEFLKARKKCAEEKSINSECGASGTGTNSIWNIVAQGGGLCSVDDPNCTESVSIEHSALAGLGNATVAIMTSPPANTAMGLRDLARTFGLPTPVYAQGIGFSGLAPMQDLWKAFRNIAYLLLSLILIIVGFMVMFRKKIDPKTVVTVQNSIPRIVIALALITLSYMIVGFMIDLMYLSIVMISSILIPANSTFSPTEVTGQIIGGGFWGFAYGFFSRFWEIGLSLYDMFTGGPGAAGLTNKAVLSTATGLIGLVVLGGPKGAIAGVLAPPALLMLIVVLALIFGFVRLVFLLIDAYINIVLSLITAPLQLMLEAVPGSNAFSSWFKNLITKLIVFPVTAALIIIAGILTQYDSSTTPLWAPPFLSSNGSPYGIGSLIGLGMMLIVPNIVGSIQKALKAEPAIPGGIGPVLGPLGSAGGTLMQLAYQGSFIASSLRHKPDTRTPSQVVRQGSEKGIGGILGGGEGH